MKRIALTEEATVQLVANAASLLTALDEGWPDDPDLDSDMRIALEGLEKMMNDIIRLAGIDISKAPAPKTEGYSDGVSTA